MERERWRQVEAVFQAAQERAPSERAAFLERACGEDAQLRQEVESLLRAATDTSFMEPSPGFPDLSPTQTPPARAGPELLEPLQQALGSSYRMERELGRGGMATVYLAHDLKHDRKIALKVLSPDLGHALGQERFLKEIRLTARLDHPHILPVLDSGESAERLWYTMPYVEGESLHDRLRREIQLPVEEAVRLVCEVAEALQYAHQHGVVHRDIKPENILLSQGHARVADFGVAQALEAGRDRLTATGLALGTPAYMSPEQASGGTVDARSDVYALGCVLYEMLVGEPPYTGPTPQAIIAKRFSGPIPSVRTVRPDVSPAMDLVISKALAQSLGGRFATPGELAVAVTRAAVGDSPGSTVAQPDRRWTTRRRTVLMGAAALLLVVGGVIVARRGGGTPQNSTDGSRMLVVLPFKNLGAPTDQYFADGLTEEITSRLAAMGDLGVISRSSAERYRVSGKSLRQVGQELGVGYILDGSIRWDRLPDGTSRVRVTPQLIRIADDRNVWANRYDADLRNIFEIQANIAEQVATALGLVVAAPAPGPAEKPTTNLSAYDAYLRGNAELPSDFYGNQGQILTRLERAAENYREAVRFDSTFALAYAKLGIVALQLSRPAEAKTAIERALQLDANLAEAHYARGMYYLGVESDTTEGFKELEIAVRQRPNDAELLMELANTEWNLRGPKSQAITRAERAVQLDPRNQRRVVVLAFLYQEAQRFDEAERTYDRAIALRPENPGPYTQKAVNYLIGYGDIARARQVLRQAAAHVDTMELISAAATTLMPQHFLGVLDEGYQQAALGLPVSAFARDTVWYGVAKGAIYRAHGDSVRFHAYFDTAFAVLQARNKQNSQQPDYFMMSFLLGARGQREQAYAAFAKARAAMGRHLIRDEFEARLAVIAGDYERAIDILERKNWGSELTVPWLRADPFWDPLRSAPRFQRLIYSTAND